MIITGTMKPKDGIIFLKVQASEGNGMAHCSNLSNSVMFPDKCVILQNLGCYLTGPARYIFFPFDIMTDTPEEVAMEMVQELDIIDWDPNEIAEMIEAEISILMPHWKKWVSSRSQSYQEDDYDGAPELHHSSSCSSSAASGVLSSHGSDQLLVGNNRLRGLYMDTSMYMDISFLSIYADLLKC